MDKNNEQSRDVKALEKILEYKMASDNMDDAIPEIIRWANTRSTPKEEWISVKDRLPKLDDQYLCRMWEDGPDYRVIRFYTDKKQWGIYRTKTSPFNVSYWMPLPSPPITGLLKKALELEEGTEVGAGAHYLKNLPKDQTEKECETCGGKGVVDTDAGFDLRGYYTRKKPCPDCQKANQLKPKGGE